MKTTKIEYFTDGACEPNPGPGGWGFVIKEGGTFKFARWGCDDYTTNNIMELTAILEALEDIDKKHTDVTIHSDSRYCVDGINSWMFKWQKKGWTKKGGKIKNLALWKEVYETRLKKPHVRIKWIKGHNGYQGNELADQYAESASFHQFDGESKLDIKSLHEI